MSLKVSPGAVPSATSDRFRASRPQVGWLRRCCPQPWLVPLATWPIPADPEACELSRLPSSTWPVHSRGPLPPIRPTPSVSRLWSSAGWQAPGGFAGVRRGAYVIDHLLGSDRPEDRYCAEVRAVPLSRGRQTWASHHAALALSGLPLVDCDLTRIDVCSPVERTFTRSRLTTHPLPPGHESQAIGGARSVSLPLALSQVQPRSLRAAVVAAANAALREGLVATRATSRSCLAVLDPFRRRPAGRIARRVAHTPGSCGHSAGAFAAKCGSTTDPD